MTRRYATVTTTENRASQAIPPEMLLPGRHHLFTPSRSISLPPGLSTPADAARVVRTLRALVEECGSRR